MRGETALSHASEPHCTATPRGRLSGLTRRGFGRGKERVVQRGAPEGIMRSARACGAALGSESAAQHRERASTQFQGKEDKQHMPLLTSRCSDVVAT